MAQECDEDGTSTVRFRVSGIATGPYPGPFTETGTLTIGAQTLDRQDVNGTQQAGPVLTFTATFTITSGTTTVTGTKTLSATFLYPGTSDPAPWSSVGACASFENSTKLASLSPVYYATISGRTYMADVSSTYTATITTDTGTIHDTGYALTSLNETYLTGGTCAATTPGCQIAGSAASAPFTERFLSAAQAATPTRVVLSPATATNTVGAQHCVTATATDASGNPTSGYTVYFTVAGTTTGRDTSSGSAVTGSNGQATFCYTAQFPGVDMITATVDANKNGSGEATEPTSTATKTYVLPVSTPLCQVSITNGGRITANNGDRATFGGNAQVPKSGQPKGNEEYQDHGPVTNINVKSTKILAVTCSADKKQATIYGQATINGSGSYLFRIDVKDVAEPGVRRDTYRILLSNGYDSGEHILEGGNIQIRIG